jgi:putative transposase
MAGDSKIASRALVGGASSDLSAADHQCDFVPQSDGLSVAVSAQRFSQVEDRVHGLLALAPRWVWDQIHDALCRRVRQQVGKKATPSVAIIDSQSIRTAEGGRDRGYDAGKKITGRKRHLAVDTLGLICAVAVHAAGWQDHDGACFLFNQLRVFQRLKVLFADSAYARNGLPDWIKQQYGWVLQTILRPVHVKGFVALPKRWIVERTFAWLGLHRRHSKDYEHNPKTSEAMIRISMISLMSRRLANDFKV